MIATAVSHKVTMLISAAVMFTVMSAVTLAHPVSAQLATAQQAATGSGLPLPRFVSLKSDRVNVRKGPGMEYPIAWVFKRAGLPVEVLREYEGWREIRDAEGATGWVTQSLLSGRRTALVAPTLKSDPQKPGDASSSVALRASDNDTAGTVVDVETGVIASVFSCDGRWCQVAVEDFKGYLPQKSLWGIYGDERFK